MDLLNNNLLYAASGAYGGDVSPARRAETAAGQHPKAVVITCSDSRVIPEVIFGAGIGELFVVRTAGNVVGPAERASVDYAVRHLHVGTVLLLGHTGCGAVAAALSGETEGAVGVITRKIVRAIGKEKNPDAACVRNVRASVRILRSFLPDGISVSGAVYDLASGTVSAV